MVTSRGVVSGSRQHVLSHCRCLDVSSWEMEYSEGSSGARGRSVERFRKSNALSKHGVVSIRSVDWAKNREIMC